MSSTKSNAIHELIWKGRRCTDCGSEKVASVSVPREMAEGEPVEAARLGQSCWCEECFWRHFDKDGHRPH
jgi:hypothetical protein